MATALEREPQTKVTEIPQIPEIPPEVERVGVGTVSSNFTAQVKGDNGAPLIQATPASVIVINPPSDQPTLVKQSKGSVSDSITWLAMFWLRAIRRAIHFGWKIINKNS